MATENVPGPLAHAADCHFAIEPRDPARDFDRWYALELQSSHAGWARWTQTTSATSISTKLTQHLELKRAGRIVVVERESTFIETLAGNPVSLTIIDRLADEPTTTTYQYSKDGISASVQQGRNGQPRGTKHAPIQGTWLTPAAAAIFLTQRLASDAKEIVVRTVEPGGGPDPVLVTRRIVSKTQTESMGKTVSAFNVTLAPSKPGAPSGTELLDERGAIIRSSIRMGEMLLTMTLTDAATARSRIDPPELLSTLLVKSDRPIDRPRQTTRAIYVLTVRDTPKPDHDQPAVPEKDALPAPQPLAPPEPFAATTSVQRVERIDARSVRLTISLDSPFPAPPEDAKDEQYRRPSAYISSDDQLVQRLARQAVSATEKSIPKKAEAARRFVHSYITKKDLGVAFAPASEVARSRAGDCTEHAVLLAAMLRSLDIPSRVVSGLVYVDALGSEKHLFAYHMWTQALIQTDADSRWVDLDATLPSQHAFDATHLALIATALNEDQPNDSLAQLTPLLGALKIEVLPQGGHAPD